MERQNENNEGNGSAIAVALLAGMAVLMLVLLVLLSGCKTRYIEVEKVRHVPIEVHDTLTHYQLKRDSVYLKDSVFIHQKGDTIYSEKWHTAYRWKYHIDTLRIIKEMPIFTTDTITQVKPVRVTKEVVKYRQHWWQKWLAWIGGVVVLAGGVKAVMWARKKGFL